MKQALIPGGGWAGVQSHYSAVGGQHPRRSIWQSVGTNMPSFAAQRAWLQARLHYVCIISMPVQQDLGASAATISPATVFSRTGERLFRQRVANQFCPAATVARADCRLCRQGSPRRTASLLEGVGDQ